MNIDKEGRIMMMPTNKINMEIIKDNKDKIIITDSIHQASIISQDMEGRIIMEEKTIMEEIIVMEDRIIMEEIIVLEEIIIMEEITITKRNIIQTDITTTIITTGIINITEIIIRIITTIILIITLTPTIGRNQIIIRMAMDLEASLDKI